MDARIALPGQVRIPHRWLPWSVAIVEAMLVATLAALLLARGGETPTKALSTSVMPHSVVAPPYSDAITGTGPALARVSGAGNYGITGTGPGLLQIAGAGNYGITGTGPGLLQVAGSALPSLGLRDDFATRHLISAPAAPAGQASSDQTGRCLLRGKC